MKELSDLEICKRIAKIEGYIPTEEHCHIFGKWINSNSGKRHGSLLTYGDFNPIKDDALCFQLMVKHKVIPGYCRDGTNYAVIDHPNQPVAVADCNADDPNKAICLAIIEAHNEKG